MSEVTNICNAESDLRRQLLTTVSAFALFTFFGIVRATAEADVDRPTVWIELGGVSERQTDQSGTFVPAFVTNNLSAPAFQGFDLRAQKAPLYTNGAEGKITFEPNGTSWVFSASALYGRANGSRDVNHASAGHRLHNKTLYVTYGAPSPSGYRSKHFHCCTTHYYTPSNHAFVNMQVRSHQSHAIVDFQAGRDVGVGLFGNDSTSTISAGVRFVQFVSGTDISIHARPDVQFQKQIGHFRGYTYTRYSEVNQFKHLYSASAQTARSFHGVGPAISWNGSTPLLGNSQRGEIAFDWGANAAVLFGRQKVVGHHSTYGIYLASYPSIAARYTHPGSFNRRRTVTIPDVGGLAGISFRYANAKISVGYRGDFFFGAMDVGQDAEKTKTVGFYGPFASLSIGLGG